MRTLAGAAAFGLALAVGGCGSSPSQTVRVRPVVRLVDVRYQRPGELTTVDIPTAVIGGEQRPVLMESPAVTLRIEPLSGSVPEATTLALPIPEQLRGASLRLSALGLQVAVLDQHPRVLADARAEETVDIRLGDVERDPRQPVTRSVLVSARRGPAEARWRSGSLAIPPGARLRFGIGIEDIDWPAGLPAVKFAIAAFDPAAPNQAPEVLFEARLDPAADATRHRWFDHEVDLGARAGRELQLEFSAIPEETGAEVPFVFPVWSDPTIVVPDHEPRPRPNLVLVSLDTLRADHLGCYGYDRPTSPTIDRFATRSTLFERAYSSFSSTGGSHMTLLTGLYPCVHGIAVYAHTLDRNQSTLAELLRAQGYATGAFTEDGGIVRRLGFGRGFSAYVENLTVKGNGAQPPGERTFGDAIAWIEKQAGGTPWFSFIHTYQVHIPLAPPAGYVTRVAPEHAHDATMPEPVLYDGELRYLDDLVAQLLDALDRTGMAGNTIVILMSDHGEQFGEHGIHGHQNSLYDTLLHVPLIIHAPGLPAGRRVVQPVGLVDVVPTALDLLGLPPAAGVQGRSLVPAVRGETLPEVPLFAELPAPYDQVSVRKGSRKWIVHEKTGEVEAFTDDDPREEHSVPGLGAEGAALVADYRKTCRTLQASAAAPTLDAVDPFLVREKLRALGYIQ